MNYYCIFLVFCVELVQVLGDDASFCSQWNKEDEINEEKSLLQAFVNYVNSTVKYLDDFLNFFGKKCEKKAKPKSTKKKCGK